MGDLAVFYTNVIFAENGLLMSILFLFATYLSGSLWGGVITVAAFFYNHGEVSLCVTGREHLNFLAQLSAKSRKIMQTSQTTMAQFHKAYKHKNMRFTPKKRLLSKNSLPART